ncbi:DUF4365 domain-containing protein [Micromonosporaceae bacterium Da 78-11]
MSSGRQGPFPVGRWTYDLTPAGPAAAEIYDCTDVPPDDRAAKDDGNIRQAATTEPLAASGGRSPGAIRSRCSNETQSPGLPSPDNRAMTALATVVAQERHQGLHGEGFIYALACAGGFTSSKANLDLDGVDRQIAHAGPRGTSRSPKIELQVKSSSVPTLAGDVIRHRLDVAHFNHLAGSGFQIPRFLSVVIVPADAEHYATCTHEHMRLATAAYWLSLADREILPTGGVLPESVVVEVPLRNLLTVTTLGCLLSGDLEGATR